MPGACPLTWAWALDVGVVGDGDVAVGAAKNPRRDGDGKIWPAP
jgi:hypothetical protein